MSNLKPWKPGQSGNPSGRPKGIAALARECVDDRKMIELLVSIAEDERAGKRDRISAVSLLWDRMYGKAPSHVPIEGMDPLELDAVAVEISKLQAHVDALREAKQAA